MVPSIRTGQYGTCSQDADKNLERLEIKPTVQPFAARIGGNQSLVLDPNDESNAELLKRVPDAAPLLSIKKTFSLKAFTDISLWKLSLVECDL
ncbi:hypothetical protein ASPACDRAFT_44287 [Aspergillus aculeatus ATCC 16872]|uniref:Uncharacterized protein n=1 Tax=Aspergillus aculeatus (strain ATCC 16872 / CBS 172.66 / WB 5094) TaxID=690307 RepID=A0A1L9WR40_ASPA1|nr:uncharacterized protein ASPACDRAFT_44287 [Aspergillus aculeatus ATCC 16872]OJJ98655.1 hypothetical protein ASPACDRAFT_44287 [Aspergillus aculeatus ATCC 16872]